MRSEVRLAKWVRPVMASAAVFALVLSASAAFYPSAKVGPWSGSVGKATQTQIAETIASADAVMAVLGSSDPEAWRGEVFGATYGTAGAVEARSVIGDIRDALADLRENWDRISVQTVSLKTGWNAFCVYVSDPAPPRAVFNPSGYAEYEVARVRAKFATVGVAETNLLESVGNLAEQFVQIRARILEAFTSSAVNDLPMESVYVLQGSTTEGASFATDASSEAEGADPWSSWSASAPDAVNLPYLPAGRVFMGCSTSKVTRTFAFIGQGVRAGSMTWHKAGGSDNQSTWNFLGFPLRVSGAQVGAVMRDTDFGPESCCRVTGTGVLPTFVKASTVTDGAVLVCDAKGPSSWYPAPTASPLAGVTIGSGDEASSFTLRNDTSAAQTITGTIYRTGILSSALKGGSLACVEVRVNRYLGWEKWYFSGESAVSNLEFHVSLAAGESRTFEIRFDREAFDREAQLYEYGRDFVRRFSAVMRFAYGDSPACTYLGLVGEADNDEVTSAWPIGLWSGTLTLDRVSQVRGNQTIVHDVPAGGTMSVRVILHVDDKKGDKQTVRLLHHVTVQTIVTSNEVNGVYSVARLYAGKAKPADASAGTVTRLDAIAMDIDHSVVPGSGSFDKSVTFDWKMAPDGRGNPFRHPYHPEHDGLQWDFKTPAPSGDDMNNYRQGEIKPETWSIRNRLELTVDASSASERSETVSGSCVWTLGNLRRKVNGEDIRMTGTFTLDRLQSVGEIEIGEIEK